MVERLIKFYCDCKYEHFYVPADKCFDEDEILCPYCGEEPHSFDIKHIKYITEAEYANEIAKYTK